MQKWLISADTQKWDIAAFLAESGKVDWKKRYNYEIGDIVYIYCKQPVAKIMFKTSVSEMSSNQNSEDDWVIFQLMEYIDNDDLSLDNLRMHGLKIPPMGAMKIEGELEKYIDKCFEDCSVIDDENPKMWVVNAGEDSVKLNTFINHNFIGIDKPLGDLSGKNRDELKVICEESDLDNSSCLYKLDSFVNQINFGDYIITKDTLNKEFHIGRCTSDYYYSEKMDDSEVDIPYNHCRDVAWLDETIKREDFSNEFLNYIDINGSLQEIKNDDAKQEILNFYNFNFLSNEKRNLIYFGAPGTGKSHNLKEHVEKFLKKHVDNIENNYERVTFHPDYTYANFVGTYKPVIDNKKVTYKHVLEENNEITFKPILDNNEITYKFVPGPFMRTLIKALSNPYEPFILIIEEINRANVAAVFGDVFQLLDRDELYNSKFSINASEDMKTYIKSEFVLPNIPEYRSFTLNNHLNFIFGERFEKIKIPSNMFIWATMNSADQGVFPMDTAFKRRWDFEYIGINDGVNDKVENLKVVLNGEEIYWNNLRTAINKKLLSFGINEDKLMGPFYAFKEFLDSGVIPEDEFKNTFKNKIIMYLFEDAARSRRDVLFNIKSKENIIFSDICNAFDGENGIRIFSEDVNKDIFNENN